MLYAVGILFNLIWFNVTHFICIFCNSCPCLCPRCRNKIYSFITCPLGVVFIFSLLPWPSSSVSLSYVIIVVPMRKCWGQHSCMSDNDERFWKKSIVRYYLIENINPFIAINCILSYSNLTIEHVMNYSLIYFPINGLCTENGPLSQRTPTQSSQ